MSQPGTREVEHEIKVLAPPDVVYQVIVEAANWPQIFPPSVHVECLERSAERELIQIWATANGEVKTWTSRRVLDSKTLRIEFHQEMSQPPVGAMGGTWMVEPISDGESLVRLQHDYRAVDGDPKKLEWIDRAVDRNSRAELAALQTNAELATRAPGLLLTFDDIVQIDGSAKDVYDFINEAHLWPQRLPHVVRVSLWEDTPGLQFLEMATRGKDESVHTTTSVRVAFPYVKIVYKQIQTPALMTLHTGHWLLEEKSDGATATFHHTVAINDANIAKILGDEVSIDDARAFVRTALRTNSLTTLGHAKEYAEGRS